MVSIQEEIDDRHISRLVRELSDRAKASRIRNVIIDLHEVEAVDTYLAGEIENLAAILYLLRTSTIVVGLSVPVVMTLLDFGIRFNGVKFALDVEQALARIEYAEGRNREPDDLLKDKEQCDVHSPLPSSPD